MFSTFARANFSASDHMTFGSGIAMRSPPSLAVLSIASAAILSSSSYRLRSSRAKMVLRVLRITVSKAAYMASAGLDSTPRAAVAALLSMPAVST